jgi:hypothetical protein
MNMGPEIVAQPVQPVVQQPAQQPAQQPVQKPISHDVMMTALQNLHDENPAEFLRLTKLMSDAPVVQHAHVLAANPPPAAPAAPPTVIDTAYRGFKPLRPERYDGKKEEYAAWSFTMRLYLANTMSEQAIESRKGVEAVGSYLGGRARIWFMKQHQRLTGATMLFEQLESDQCIESLPVVFRAKLEAFCNQPWTGSMEDYNELFAPMAVWVEDGMDVETLRGHYMFPLPQWIKDYVLLHPAGTWRDAMKLIESWLSKRNLLNRLPSCQPLPKLQGTAMGPTPMEVGAVPTSAPAAAATTRTPARTQTTPAPAAAAARTIPGHEYWKDKFCDACGQKGHGKRWRGCPKHPAYRPGQQVKTYAAAVETDHHSPVAAADATATPAATAIPAATASTSAAATANTSPELTELAELRVEVKNLAAMMSAMASNF